jgi:glycerate dehydrogenase
LGKCEIYDRTSSADTVDRARGAEIVLTNKVVLGGKEIGLLPDLKYIGVLATGTNVVDLEAARERGIPVTNVPAYSTLSVAQLTFALLLELTHHAGHHARTVQEGKWTRNADFSYSDFPLVELDGLTLGLVGFGKIGQAVARIGLALGMQVVVHVPTPKPGWEQVRFTDLETVFRESDVLSLHCPLTPGTRELINPERIGWMKPGAIVLNTGRGGLVDEAALASALNSGRLAGAGLDVLSTEPPQATNPLLSARNCVITPHLAWASQAARKRLMHEAVENVRQFLRGVPRNRVA